MRFLVVDDDAMSRRIVQLMLKPYGECVCVENGEAGLEAHRQSIEEKSPFAVIYLDMLMPGLGGLEFLEVLRKTEREQRSASAVPVVMLTGDAHVSRISQAQALGVAEYLLKPIVEERLIQGLERLDLLDPEQDDQVA
jgi:two-component system chemotaxis response regulator CheY